MTIQFFKTFADFAMTLSHFPKVVANFCALAQNLLATCAAAVEPLQISAIALKLGLIPAQLSTVTL
jgi:hypothetical protein